jgi:hypothetical protein
VEVAAFVDFAVGEDGCVACVFAGVVDALAGAGGVEGGDGAVPRRRRRRRWRWERRGSEAEAGVRMTRCEWTVQQKCI